MIRCTVKQNQMGHLTVTFDDHPGLSLYLQIDTDIAAFIDHCGATDDSDPEDITRCPDEYLGVAA